MARPNRILRYGALLWPLCLAAQTPADLASIVERLERLERENRALAQEVKLLRAKLDASDVAAAEPEPAAGATPQAAPASIDERLRIEERRTEELAQTKVESSQKFPIRLTGIALFNAFLNSKQSGAFDYPIVAQP